MLIGLLMLLGPGVFFLVTLPLSGKFKPGVRKAYRVLGGVVVLLGSGTSYYLAAYTGDQGGIGAYFFQIGVILTYIAISISLIGINWFLTIKELRTTEFQQDVEAGDSGLRTESDRGEKDS